MRFPEMRMPPKLKEIYHPAEGWVEHAYYVVEASFNNNNPVWNYIYFTGFLRDGIPSGYNQIVSKSDDILKYTDAHYLKPLSLVARENDYGVLIAASRKMDKWEKQ